MARLLSALCVFCLVGCDDEPVDLRFHTPKATIDTLLEVYGVLELPQAEIDRRVEIGRTFHLNDPDTMRACFKDFEGPADDGLVGYVFGSLASAKDDLRITVTGDRARAAIALATLEAIEEERLLTAVRTQGEYFVEQLRELAARHPTLVSQPRGVGFLLAFDMPTPELRNTFLVRAREKGVMASYTGTRSVRLRPHLITTRKEIDEALAVFGAVLDELV